MCLYKLYIVCICFGFSWMHMYALPCHSILPLWHCRKKKIAILKSNSLGSRQLIRSYLCPGRRRESWSPSGCWFQSCSRGQWPASSASAGRIDLGEKQMAHSVNFTDKPCNSSVFVEKYQRSWSTCSKLFENNKQFEINTQVGIDLSDLFTNASHWPWLA